MAVVPVQLVAYDIKSCISQCYVVSCLLLDNFTATRTKRFVLSLISEISNCDDLENKKEHEMSEIYT